MRRYSTAWLAILIAATNCGDRAPKSATARTARDSVSSDVSRFAGSHNASTVWYRQAEYLSTTLQLQRLADSLGTNKRIVFTGSVANAWRDKTGTWLLLEAGAPFVDAVYRLRCEIPDARAQDLKPFAALIVVAESISVHANATLSGIGPLDEESPPTKPLTVVTGRCVDWTARNRLLQKGP